ncbi:hypothetical protein BC940DRAFT_221466, partial [Gongronella butleri]
MERHKMWTLSTGKVVEKALLDYAAHLKDENVAHSFMVDPRDPQLVIQGVFSEEELTEIASTDAKPKPQMPPKLGELIKSLRLRMRNVIANVLEDEDEDAIWVLTTIQELVTKLEYGHLDKSHYESWFDVHVWRFIDQLFVYGTQLEVVRGDCYASRASAMRRNNARADPTCRQRVGHRLDLVIRAHHTDSKVDLEFGGGESSKAFDGCSETKLMNESGLKLPKALKDMFDALTQVAPNKARKIETMGLITFG